MEEGKNTIDMGDLQEAADPLRVASPRSRIPALAARSRTVLHNRRSPSAFSFIFKLPLLFLQYGSQSGLLELNFLATNKYQFIFILEDEEYLSGRSL